MNAMRSMWLLSLFSLFFLFGCDTGGIAEPETPVTASTDGPVVNRAAASLFKASNAIVSRTSVTVFQAAGPAGETGLLNEGDTFPPTNKDKAKILRGSDYVQANINTSGLPQGAYTNWWALINETSECVPSTDPELPDLIGDCGFDELFDIGGPSEPSVFWATGGVVQANGIGNFQDRTSVGDPFGDPFPVQHLWGPGLTNPSGAMVIYIIKYHGLASSDPDEFYAQTHSLLGLCNEAANAHIDGNCFDPQWAIFVD